MDLTVEDVAEFLHISETTVRRLLSDRKIPSYRIRDQDRFSRIEIEEWMLNSPEDYLSSVDFLKGTHHFCLYRALHRGDIFPQMNKTNKEDVIRATTREIASRLNLDAEVLAELLIDREKLMSTAIGHGIAVPHTRDFLRKGPFDKVFIVYLEQPIEYGSLDGTLVHTLFFLFAGNDKGHLQLLSKLAHLGNSPQVMEFLQKKPSKKELLEFIRGWEGGFVL